MSDEIIERTGGLLVSSAAFVIVVAGMKAAASLMVPLLLAVFIAVIIASPYGWLQNRGLPPWLALVLVISGFILAVFLVGAFIGGSVQEFTRSFPLYQARLQEITADLVNWLAAKGVPVSKEVVSGYMDPGKAMKMVANVLSSMGNLLTNGFLILLTVVFLLFEAASFPDKWRAGHFNAEASLGRFSAATRNINQYMGIKTLTSAFTGIAITVWLTVMGVDFPILWGVLAFLLNFVPNIGSFIAAVPAVLLALVQLGPGSAIVAAVGFAIVNVLVGSVLEPRIMGKGLGLSTLVVFMSLVLWGWVLGPVGMLLSVPLTIAIKIALDSHEDTRWMAIMLGPAIEVPDSSEDFPETSE